jgi:hypothetical protein
VKPARCNNLRSSPSSRRARGPRACRPEIELHGFLTNALATSSAVLRKCALSTERGVGLDLLVWIVVASRPDPEGDFVMSMRRLAGLGSVFACLLVMPASVQAAPSISITGAQLGPEGGSVIVSVQYSCDVEGSSINVDVVQGKGNRLIRANGNVNTFTNPDIVVCDGLSHTAQVPATNFGSTPFKKGKASVSAALFYSSPNPITVGPVEVSLK